MIRWPWSRRPRDTEELKAAKERLARDRAHLAQQRAVSQFAAERLERAVEAEQAEIRKNHLAETIHDALALHHGRPRP